MCSTLRLYTQWMEGGELVNIRTIIQDKITKVLEYFREMTPGDEQLSQCLRQLKSWKDDPLQGMYY